MKKETVFSKDIKSYTLTELEGKFRDQSLPSYRAKQVYQWLYRGAVSFDEMSDLPKNLRDSLAEKYYISVANIEKKLVSAYDNTVKYLFSFSDGQCVESVVMHYHHGVSICISTQVGCKMDCAFCATGKSGFSRNLTASEMIAQIQAVQQDLNLRISNVVLMGMGEPLDNYDNVVRFLELVSSEQGLHIGMRHISLSTCGVVNRIYDLAEHKFQLTLSVSLHAPNDLIRSKIMPVNRKWGVETLMAACRHYAQVTGRRISFEYAMIDGVNDSDACAVELAALLRGTLSHVNLIPVNDVGGAGYRKSSPVRIELFCKTLEKFGVTATVRRTLGADIDASCGQLRRRYKEEVANVEHSKFK